MLRVLGIETSCDDTAVGIVTYNQGSFAIEAQVTASQALTHRKYGGVVPEVAAREHTVTIIPTIQAALRKSRLGWKQIDAIAVTAGPGLNTALLVGVETARVLSYTLQKPLVRVNHIEGHIAANWIQARPPIRFPALALVVSGGHTELILVKQLGSYTLLGRTRDDAVGEAFDKVAKLLGLPYPGGPEVAARATKGNDARFQFPVALQKNGSLDFSYAGLKTAVLYELQKHRKQPPVLVRDISASFQAAAVQQLVNKAQAAMQKTGAKTFLLAGGVAANQQLRKKIRTMIKKEFPRTMYRQPPLQLCMDNGVMIAMAACLRLRSGNQGAVIPWQKIAADPNWELV